MSQAGVLNTSSSGGSGIETIQLDSGTISGSTVTVNTTNVAGGTVVFLADTSNFAELDFTDQNNNTCLGKFAGSSFISGTSNTSLGSQSLNGLSSGSSNCAVGYASLTPIQTGSNNSAIGFESGGVAPFDGSNNVFIGSLTGNAYNSTEASNILINNQGVQGENNVIRIGTAGVGLGQQNSCFIAGISGVTVVNSATVLIDTVTGQLGTVASSIRYKENIESMDDESSSILDLRPVVFNYKKDKAKTKHYGLIAEEVEKVSPELVVYNLEGLPETVKYHDLSILLLNEMQKLKKEIVELKKIIQSDK